MKKRVVLGTLSLPLALLCAAYMVQNATSWRPQLVGTDPDGICQIIWSRDSRLVQLEPVNVMQNLVWNTATLDANRLKRVANESFASSSPPSLECNQNFDSSPELFKGDALSVCREGDCIHLEGTDAKRFGETMHSDPTTLNWNFDDYQFSRDGSEVSILSSGSRWTWSTKSGVLLRREPLRVRGVSFSSSADVFWSSDGNYGTTTRVQFFDGKSGKFLWRCASCANPTFDAQKNLAIVAGSNGFELRDLRTGKIERVVKGPSSDAAVLSVSPDDKWLWSSHNDGQIWRHRLH